MHDIDRAYQTSSALFERCNRLDLEPELVVRLYITQAKMAWGVGRFKSSLRLLNQALKKTNTFAISHNRAEIYLRRGVSHFSLKHYLRATEDLAQATELAIDALNVEVAIEAYLYIGVLYVIFGRHADADELLRLGFQLAHAIDNSRLISKSAIFLSGRLVEQVQYQAALDILYQSEAYLLEHGDMTWVVEAGKTAAVCYQHLGRIAEAELYFEAMLAISRQQNIRWATSVLAVHYAEYLLNQGQLSQVLQMLSLAEPGLQTFDDVALQQKSQFLRVEAFKQMHDFKLALAHFKQYEALKIRWIAGEISEQEIKKIARFNRLNLLAKNIKRTQKDFESLLGLVVFRSSVSRGRLLKERCEKLSSQHQLVFVEIDTKLIFRRIIEKKVSGILREFCLSGDLWVRVNVGKYLIFFNDGLTQNELLISELLNQFNNFPWAWHDCEPPRINFTYLSPQAAIEKIPMRVE
ncbi:hypothetical protein HZU75_04840 [Chitinibacter fontanus]|uniref:Tetratricopeptide repeat protein n=1 Tax=Chitinibacter fontanus TaxID=1737446 RepID=A0A7D5Z9Q0_9NEIS|nr:hypothetical protein [Chitinibacter fontanus]QLI80905.1 hypothetical protein HZU75_04840 [Chitinibacter fontanus]